MFLFLFFIKQKDGSFRDDLETPNGPFNERKRLSSSFHAMTHLSVSSFHIDHDDLTTRSTVNLLLTK